MEQTETEKALLLQLANNTDKAMETALELDLQPHHFVSHPDIFEWLRNDFRAFYGSALRRPGQWHHDLISLVQQFPAKKPFIVDMFSAVSTKNPEYFIRALVNDYNVKRDKARSTWYHTQLCIAEKTRNYEVAEQAKTSMVNSLINKDDVCKWDGIMSPKEVKQVTEEVTYPQKGNQFYKTGFEILDRTIVGIRGGRLTTVIAETNRGKTTFALNLAINATLQGGKVMYFSVEDDKAFLYAKLLSIINQWTFKSIYSGDTTPQQKKTIELQLRELAKNKNFFISDSLGNRFERVEEQIYALHRAGMINFVVIDYIQGFTLNEDLSERDMIAKISRKLTNIGRTLQIPILVLAQAKRREKVYSNEEESYDVPSTNMKNNIYGSAQVAKDSLTVLYLAKTEECGDCIVVCKSKAHGLSVVPFKYNLLSGEMKDKDDKRSLKYFRSNLLQPVK